jgi:uridine phosphorylase
MGMPNMDFVVRENRAVVHGQMAIVRLGTCGAVQRPAKLGDLLLASHGSIAIRRDPDYWTLLEGYESHAAKGSAGNGKSNGSANGHSLAGRKPYAMSLPVPANEQLAALLAVEAARVVGTDRVVEGLNASADSFYSSQVR